MHTVIFPDLPSLEAAVEAVAAANGATGTPDDSSTPIFTAERVLDIALLAAENEEASA